MIEKINVVQAEQNISVKSGIQNFEELEVKFQEQAVKIRETVIDEDNYKEMKVELNNLLEPAKIIRKIAAAFNKEGKSAIKVTYDKMKEIEDIVRSEVEAKKEEVAEFEEARRQKMLTVKKEATQELLDNCNEQIAQMQAHLLTFNQIEFLDDWATWSIAKIEKAIQDAYNAEYRRHKDATTRLKLAELKCKELKSYYELETNINYIALLGATIYENENWESDLEAEAEKIQIQQEELRERLEEKARLEAEEKVRKEQEKKDIIQREEQAKREADIRAEEEAKRKSEEERAKIEAEKPKQIEISTKVVEAQETKITESSNEKEVETRDYNLMIKQITSKQANDLVKFLKENNIKFEVK